MTHSERFYADLPPFRAFEDFADFEAYRPVPEDWVVLSGDIAGSTAAIAEGRYKEVNTLGAAVITAVLNTCREVAVPYAFGGDGGTVVVPGRRAAAAAAALSRLQSHAVDAFGLRLRGAAVPVARLRAEGHDVRVRRLRLNGPNHLAMFSGGGIERVDGILRGAPGDPDLLAPAAGAGPPDLEGLSCRWEPLAATRGCMMALMVMPLSADPAGAYRRIATQLSAILDGNVPAHAPVRDDTLRFRWPPRGLRLEAALARGAWRAWATGAFQSLVQQWCHWRRGRLGPYDAPRYLDEMKAQTDFRKFDGCLRVVLDLSDAQAAAIEAWLGREHLAGRLVHGLHRDSEALMTCLVFSLERSEHVHFVDAAGGGFAKAAEAFKRRLASVTAPDRQAS